MRIIIHTMYFLPEFGSAPILMNEMASYFASKGHKVEIVTTIPRQRSGKYKGRFYINEYSNGFRIKRFWINAGSSSISRLLAWNIYTLWTIFNILTVHKSDVVFLRLPPLQLGITGILLKKLKGVRVFLNIQDIYPDLAIESGILKNSLVIRMAKTFEKWIYAKLQKIIVISDGFKKNLIDKGVPPEKITVIPNWVDTNILRPLPKDNYIAKKFFAENKFVVMYSGNVSLSNFESLEQIIEIAQSFKDDDIIFAIVGDGFKKQSLQEKAEKLGLNNVTFIPFQPYEDLPYLLAGSDVLLVPLDKDKSQLSVPSKLYNFMATGKPILGLTDSDSEVANIITEANCGIYAPPDNLERIKKAIITLKDSKDYRETLGENGRKYALEKFSREHILRTYEEILFS